MSGFYKYQDDNLFHAPNFVATPTYSLEVALKDTYTYPVDGWIYCESKQVALDYFGLTEQEDGTITSTGIRVWKVRQLVAQYVLEQELAEEDLQSLIGLYLPWKEDEIFQTENGQLPLVVRSYEGKLYKLLLPHTTQADWTPDVTPALWKVFTPAGVIPDWVQPINAQTAYRINEKVTHLGKIWLNELDYNTYEPGVYGWRDTSLPPDNPCQTAPAWDIANYTLYIVGYVVKHNNAIYSAKNLTHTWMAPAKTGDGALSWTWIQDCDT